MLNGGPKHPKHPKYPILWKATDSEDLSDRSQQVRASALRAMASIKVLEVRLGMKCPLFQPTIDYQYIDKTRTGHETQSNGKFNTNAKLIAEFSYPCPSKISLKPKLYSICANGVVTPPMHKVWSIIESSPVYTGDMRKVQQVRIEAIRY